VIFFDKNVNNMQTMSTNRQSNMYVKFLPRMARFEIQGRRAILPKKSQGVILWCKERIAEAG
jgi:hypothetical protein